MENKIDLPEITSEEYLGIADSAEYYGELYASFMRDYKNTGIEHYKRVAEKHYQDAKERLALCQRYAENTHLIAGW